jgi:hypothetical protein
LNRTDDLHTQISLINNLKIEDFLWDVTVTKNYKF